MSPQVRGDSLRRLHCPRVPLQSKGYAFHPGGLPRHKGHHGMHRSYCGSMSLQYAQLVTSQSAGGMQSDFPLPVGLRGILQGAVANSVVIDAEPDDMG